MRTIRYLLEMVDMLSNLVFWVIAGGTVLAVVITPSWHTPRLLPLIGCTVFVLGYAIIGDIRRRRAQDQVDALKRNVDQLASNQEQALPVIAACVAMAQHSLLLMRQYAGRAGAPEAITMSLAAFQKKVADVSKRLAGATGYLHVVGEEDLSAQALSLCLQQLEEISQQIGALEKGAKAGLN